MKDQLFQAAICVKKSLIGGHGVFAEQDFHPGQRIEECRTLFVDNGVLPDYVFNADEACALALGYGSLYNHAKQPNALYRYDVNLKILIFEATTHIKKGEEILISYGDSWFSSRELMVKYPLSYKLRKIFSSKWWRVSLITTFIFLLIALTSGFPA